MDIKGWQYYNHAAIPTTAPHEPVNVSPLADKTIWKLADVHRGGTPILAQWTTDFDCDEETNWWYVIKDTPFDISALKAKRRYEINKGLKNFRIERIDPAEYSDAIYEVATEAYKMYPEAYRPNIHRESFVKSIAHWKFKSYGAFCVETGKLCGYALLSETEKYMNFAVQKTIPEYEKLGLNAALVAGILADNNAFLEQGGYICDGSRSINHATAFQDYLEKYFGFRKAYCRLHIRYRLPVNAAVAVLYPFRKLLQKLDRISIVHRVNGILLMEEICRKDGKK